jgi:hypothetical protein
MMRDRILRHLDWTSLSYLLFVVYLLLIFWTFTDYGIIWDEYWQSTYGEYVIRWYTTHLRDPAALTYRDLQLYGGLFDVLAQMATRFSPIGIFETRHFVNALFGLLTVVGAYQLGMYLAGPLAGFLSALFLLLTPSFYGHAFNNPKDIPFAALFLISLSYITQSVGSLPHLSRGWIVKLGLAVGLALGIRVGGVLLLGYIMVAFCLAWIVRSLRKRNRSLGLEGFKSAVAVFGRGFLGICAIAYIVMLVWWPAAQAKPVFQPVRALWKTSHFYWPQQVFFEGRFIPFTAIPRYYILKWILISLPEFYFVSLAVGLVLAGMAIARFRTVRNENRFVEYSLLAFSILFPIAYAAVSRAVLYDGLRLFLFGIPPLAFLAGTAVAKLIEQHGRRTIAVAVALIIAASLVLTAADMIELHPYETIFFNRLFGKGLKEASRSFDTEFWGSSYKEGVEWIVKNYRAAPGDGKIKVASCSHPFSTEYYLPKDRFLYVGSYDYQERMTGRPNLFLATTRWHCDQTLQGRVLHVVSRKGTPLLYVKEVSESAQPSRPY